VQPTRACWVGDHHCLIPTFRAWDSFLSSWLRADRATIGTRRRGRGSIASRVLGAVYDRLPRAPQREIGSIAPRSVTFGCLGSYGARHNFWRVNIAIDWPGVIKGNREMGQCSRPAHVEPIARYDSTPLSVLGESLNLWPSTSGQPSRGFSGIGIDAGRICSDRRARSR